MSYRIPIWYRGETYEYVLTVTEDGQPRNLDDVVAIELQVKSTPGAADPPLVSLSLSSGITRRTQTGDDVGKADILWPSSALASVPAGYVWMDVVCVFPGDPVVRKYVVKPTYYAVKDVVNQP